MPRKWDSADHERLLMVIIDNFKIKMDVVAAAWAKKYPTDEEPPTRRALEQHVDKLKKKTSIGAATPTKGTPRKLDAEPRPPRTPKTPKNATTTKTPETTGSKRKATAAVLSMSEEDESEPDVKAMKLGHSVQRRLSIPRRSKSVQPARFEEEDGVDRMNGEGRLGARFGVKAAVEDEDGEDSDVSDFAKSFL